MRTKYIIQKFSALTFLVLSVILFIKPFQGQAQENSKRYYVTTNIMAPFSGLNKNSAAANALLPLVSNLEYGINVNGGAFKDFHFTELRLTYGKSNVYSIIPQMQLGYYYLLVDKLKSNKSGWYIGGNLRFWTYLNTYTESSLNNVSTNLGLGHVWKKKRMIFDLRLNQPLTIYSSSNIEHSKSAFEFNFSPMPKFSKVLPFLSLNVGIMI